MTQGKREEAANVALAKCLGELLGPSFVVDGEPTGRRDRKLIDIIVRRPALDIFLEAKYDNFAAAAKAAHSRWKLEEPPNIVGAISYSPEYRRNFEAAIRKDAPIQFALSGSKYEDLTKLKRTGGIYDLAQSLRRPHAILAPHEGDDITRAIGRIKGALAVFADSNKGNPGLVKKLARVLQANFVGEKEKHVLEQSTKMAGLILLGAALFQFALADKNYDVKTPCEVMEKDGIAGLAKHWRKILEEINYASIFGIASEILKVNIKKTDMNVLIGAAAYAQEVARDGVDIMGRIYHHLLADAKPLGAFYTSIPAATMMAGLALNPADWRDKEWHDIDSVGEFRIMDPACGSGTLLAAASWQLLDNFSRAYFQKHGGKFGGEVQEHPRIKLQQNLVENIIWGYDILETAGHLTATTLGMMSPETSFKKAHIYRTIIGNTYAGAKAGSLEMMESNLPFFYREKQVEKNGKLPGDMPSFDLCIMNPPFVRGTATSKSYSFLAEPERQKVHTRMNDLARRNGFSCDKGLGPAFVALACHRRPRTPFIREGGRIAAILPQTFAAGMGNAWATARARIEKEFDLETIVVSRDSNRPNFSENTALQECFFVARKRKEKEKPTKDALFVVLHHNPTNNEEALAVAQAIIEVRNSGKKSGYLQSANNGAKPGVIKLGQFAYLPYRGKPAWRGFSFSELRLAAAAESLVQRGSLQPFAKGKMTLRKLCELAEFGGHTLDLKINHDKFKRLEIVPHKTQYAGYYPGYHKGTHGVAHKDEAGISEKPHCHLLPLEKQHQRWTDAFYAKAGRVVLNQSFRFNTARRLAALVSEPVQASHYWPIKLRKESEDKLKTLTLWLNSTPALLLIANSAQSTHGAKVGFSQKAAEELPVPDLDALAKKKGALRKAAKVFDEIAKGPGLMPLPLMEHDDERIKIDALFSDILGVSDLSSLRGALAIEPIITGKEVLAAE